ncbi:MAG: protein phosphatase CheZ [Nitrosomonas sp.]
MNQASCMISDSKDRLVYVIQQTSHATDCVLHAVEYAQPLQDELAVHAQELLAQWQLLLENSPMKHADQQALRATLTQTIDFLNEVPKKSGLTKQYLTEILITQSHQDLTGQVMQKLLQTFEIMERQQSFTKKSINTKTDIQKKETGMANGPVIDHAKQPDTLANQDQVDNLLAKLGL